MARKIELEKQLLRITEKPFDGGDLDQICYRDLSVKAP
jgi:hypothetical protein